MTKYLALAGFILLSACAAPTKPYQTENIPNGLAGDMDVCAGANGDLVSFEPCEAK